MLNWARSFAALLAFQFGRCTGCWRTLRTKAIHQDYLDGHTLLESTHVCIHCGSVEDQFAYGNYAREYWQYESEKAHPVYMWFVRSPDRIYRWIYRLLHPTKPVQAVRVGDRDESTH
jgi:hypothetical protein